MRTLQRNKKPMKYALLLGTEPIYKTDDNGNYILRNGNPIKTGEYREKYSDPKEFYSSIAMSGGDSQPVDFGLDFSNYDASLILTKDSTPIAERTLIWYTSEVEYIDDALDPQSADYVVKRKSPSLNYDKYLLERIVK